MAKTTRGGKRITATKIPTAPSPAPAPPPPAPVLTPPTPQQIAQGITLPAGGVDYDTFSKMTDDEKADVIEQAKQVATPIFLDDSVAQNLIYYTGYNQKPDMVDDATYAAASGKEIFRTVHDTYSSTNDIGYSANEIIKQIQTGSYTMLSSSGGSAHGNAIYFADNVSDSAMYASGRNNTMMRAKIKPNAIIKKEGTILKEISSEINKGTKLGRTMSKIMGSYKDSDSANAIWCMVKGYDGYVSNTYNMIVNRGALISNAKTKKVSYGTSSW